MQRLVIVVVVLGLLVISQAQIQCYTEGNIGSLLNLVNTVKVVFSASVVSTYTSNELAAAFSVRFSSGRPLLVQLATIDTNNVTLSIRKTATDFEAQTGATLFVNFTALADVPRNLTVGGTALSSGRLCTTIDRVRPALMDLYAQTDEGPNAVLLFSEPVQKCGGGNLLLSAFTRSDITTAATEMTPQGTAPSTVWYFPVSFIYNDPLATISITAGGACDSVGNTAVASAAISAKFSNGFQTFTTEQAGSFKYYDLNSNGRIDAMLLVAAFAFNDTVYPLSPVPVQVNGVNVNNSVLVAESFTTDNSVLFAFDDTDMGTVTSISTTPTTFFGPSITCDSGDARTAVDVAPPIIVSVTGTLGSNQLTVTVSEAHSSALGSSQFEVYSPYGISIAGSTGTPTTTQIALVLSDNIRYVDAFSGIGSSQVRVYLKLQAYGTTTYQGLPLWRSVSPTSDVTSAVITRSSFSEPWDTLTLNFSRALNQSSTPIVSFSDAFTISVESVTLTSQSLVIRVSRSCLSKAVPCFTTAAATAAYNLSGLTDTNGNTIGQVSSASIVQDRAPPSFVGVSLVVGSNQVRVQFSETISFSQSFVSTLGAVHSNDLEAIAVTPSTNASMYTLTLERAVLASDSASGWFPSVTIVDLSGNSRSESAPTPFALTATAFDDDKDGKVDRIRIATTRAHQSINGSMFTPFPFMEFGAATRVSSTITDLSVTEGTIAVGDSVVLQYAGNSLVLLDDDLYSGFELVAATIPVSNAAASSSGSFSDLSTGVQAGLIASIAGALLLGVVVAKYCSSPRRSISTKSRHRKQRMIRDESDSEMEMLSE